MEYATFGAGCFWGVEETFRKIPGVIETTVGFAGGHLVNPTYEDVCRGDTEHAEVVQITFDPEKISYHALLDVFWQCHDPTQLNRQGFDAGRQYRSVIFYHTPEQEKMAEASKKELEASKTYSQKIVTEIKAVEEFYKAEEYHQKYIQKKNKT